MKKTVRGPNTLKIRLELKLISKLQYARCTMARLNDKTSNMTKIAYNTYNYSEKYRKTVWPGGTSARGTANHLLLLRPNRETNIGQGIYVKIC